MKKTWLYILGFMVMGMITLGVGQARAATAPGPYYATPSWDQKLDASTRFIVLSNWNSEAVLDRETGLVWEQSPSTGTYTWDWSGDNAQHQCNVKTVGGRMGWRLPTLQELTSLVDKSVSGSPKLPSGHPFSNVHLSNYWSATTFANSTTNAWGVYFGYGGVYYYGKSSAFYVWCVRGGQGHDAQ